MPRRVTTHVDVEVQITFEEKPAGVWRGGDAKVSLNSPADAVNAIIVVIILTFCKTTNKALICLRRACAPFTFSLQKEEEQKRRRRGGEELG